MPSKIENQYGTITVDSEVIARVAGVAAMDCYGIVGMAAKNVKDGIVQLLKRESLTKGIKIEVKNKEITIDVHIIVEYGTNISSIADNIMDTIKNRVEEYIGLKVSHINIFVEGVRIGNRKPD